MIEKDYKKINELLESSIRGLDANTIVYINDMLQKAKKEAQKELLEEIIDEYNKKEERTHFGLKLLSKKERLTLN